MTLACSKGGVLVSLLSAPTLLSPQLMLASRLDAGARKDFRVLKDNLQASRPLDRSPSCAAKGTAIVTPELASQLPSRRSCLGCTRTKASTQKGHPRNRLQGPFHQFCGGSNLPLPGYNTMTALLRILALSKAPSLPAAALKVHLLFGLLPFFHFAIAAMPLQLRRLRVQHKFLNPHQCTAQPKTSLWRRPAREPLAQGTPFYSTLKQCNTVLKQ
mmetsp:Transcript_60081/g.104818  ORF Transcript_60081/g.104818 Transcript_60081/m.104818 type:complete len:215 (+) Transcript_60081:1079-1723(+)